MVRSALIVVDIQNDFCTGGALAVPNSASLIDPLNDFITQAEAKNMLISFTRDWHPLNHHSFRNFGGKWPVHCVQNSKGAQFHPQLFLPDTAVIISKGQDNTANGYSAFENNSLLAHLRNDNIERIFVVGLATDYCVKETALGAIQNGFQNVAILKDLCRSITDTPEIILDELSQRGASIKISSDCF